MDKVCAEKIFKQSVTGHSLYYTSFYGDGDSKAFPAVESPKISVKKYEYISHCQKRVTTHLQKKKKDVKELGGEGRY